MIVYAVTMPDGRVGIIRLTPKRTLHIEDFDSVEEFEAAVTIEEIKQARKLPKTLVELNDGNDPLEYIEIDDQRDLPGSRVRRDDWEIFNGKVRVKPD